MHRSYNNRVTNQLSVSAKKLSRSIVEHNPVGTFLFPFRYASTENIIELVDFGNNVTPIGNAIKHEDVSAILRGNYSERLGLPMPSISRHRLK